MSKSTSASVSGHCKVTPEEDDDATGIPITWEGSFSAGYSHSSEFTENDSESWSHSTTTTYEITVNSKQGLSQLWPWNYKMQAGPNKSWTAQSGNIALTSGPGVKPNCYRSQWRLFELYRWRLAALGSSTNTSSYPISHSNSK
jgi:hypothetical protein